MHNVTANEVTGGKLYKGEVDFNLATSSGNAKMSLHDLEEEIVVIAGAMTIFMYNWLDRYFEQKQKIQLAAIQAFEQNIGTLKYRGYRIRILLILSL